MEKLIDELIQNAQSIYKLYLKVKTSNILEEQEKYKELISYLIEKEEKLLNQAVEYYTPYLSTIVVDLMMKLDISSLNVLDNYVEINSSLLPYFRVLLKLDQLLDSSPKKINSEKIGNILLADEDGEEIKDAEFFSSREDCILDTICGALELENMLRFVNVSQNEILKNVFSKRVSHHKECILEVGEILNQIPYDMAFLNETMEELFLKDGTLNFPWKYYNVLDAYEDEFSSIELLNAIDNYNSELAIGEINKLLSLRKTRTRKVAYLRSLYLLSLIESLDKSTFYRFFSNNKELIQQIKSPYSIIKRIQEEAETYLVEEDNEVSNDIERQEVTLKHQKTQKSKNSNGEGVN